MEVVTLLVSQAVLKMEDTDSTGLSLSTQAVVTWPQALLLRPCRVLKAPPPGLSSLCSLMVSHVPPGTRADLGVTHTGHMSLLCVS